MYLPSRFAIDDLAAMHEIIRRYSFGLLITWDGGEIHATHLPVWLDTTRGPQGTLEAHLARVNPHGQALSLGAPSLVVFSGPHAYISPRWYEAPGKNVPTWNYVAVHAHGRARVVDEPEAVLAMIGRLTREHETHRERPWSVAEAQTHAERLVPHVIAFELPIERLEGKAKLSQNRTPADRLGVMAALAQEPAHGEMVDMMRALYDESGKLRAE